MANNNVEFDKDCLVFLAGLQNVDTAKKIEEIKKDIHIKAVNRAYKDMSSHVLHYSNNKFKGDNKENKNNIKMLKNEITILFFNTSGEQYFLQNQTAFNKWHNETCQTIIQIFKIDYKNIGKPIDDNKPRNDKRSKGGVNYDFSYGLAQKILNMTLKYVYIFYHYVNSMDRFYNPSKNDYLLDDEIIKFDNNMTKLLHAPVDRYVIEAACKNKKTNKYCLNIGKPRTAWSNFVFEDYRDFQKELKEKAPNKNAFIWELQNWPFGKNSEEAGD